MRGTSVGMFVAVVLSATTDAQQRTVEPAEVLCPSVLGIGVRSQTPFCDVLIQVEPRLGIQVVLPLRRGEAILSFALHNRHTYSQDEVEAGRAYTQYLATVAVATMEGEIIAEGGVWSEFRSAADLTDRIGGGAGASGLKAVAPTGMERIFVTVPQNLDQLTIVGERVEIIRSDGRDTLTSIGRPVAVLSDATLEYLPR